MSVLQRHFFIIFFTFLNLDVKVLKFSACSKNIPVITMGQKLYAETNSNKDQHSPSKGEDSAQEKPAKTDSKSEEKAASPFELLDLPQSEIEILQNLLEQKNILEQQAKHLKEEKQMVQLAHEQLDKKLEEFKVLKLALDTALSSYDTQRLENLKNTARIFDSMPAEKAALILMDLEDKKLVDIIGTMKKSANVIAAMPTEKAKHLADLLLERKKIATPKA